jgi:uncharacterized coiled-coil protein SlyX
MPDYTTLSAQIELFKTKVDALTATTMDANDLVLLASALNALGSSLGVNDILQATVDRIAAIEAAKVAAIATINSSVNGDRLTDLETSQVDQESRLDNVENFVATSLSDFSGLASQLNTINSQLGPNLPSTWKVITDSTYTIANKDRLLVIPSAGQTITLPITPSVGANVQIVDAAGTSATTNFTVLRNGTTINGAAEDLVFNVNGGNVTMVYSGSTYGWRVF